MDDLSLANAVLLVVVGVAAGVVNVLAGGGSFLTLPVLILLGLPPSVANGTNRVGILFQNVGSVWSFRRHGVWEPGSIRWAAIPASLGAVVGVWAALVIPEMAFQRLLALLMLGVMAWSLWGSRPAEEGEGRERWSPAALGVAFFLVGIYGGFVQAGVGFFVLTATTLAGFDLVRGNSIKVLTILCFTVLSLALFAWQGRVEWIAGLSLAGGTVIGGLVGTHLTVLKGDRWVRFVVTAAAVFFAIKLWLETG